MAATTRLSITLLEEGQRQKEATINTALEALADAAHTVQEITTVAGLPTASANPNALAIATNVGGSQRWLVYSDGTVWRKIVQVDNNVVS